MSDEQRLDEARHYWNAQAAAFDDEPDHGLRDPTTRQAWTTRLKTWLPAPPASVLDIGCGTGTLSVLLAEQGCDVTGVDLSPAMIARAQAKANAAARSLTFRVMDASALEFAPAAFDAIVCRHLLWTLPEPSDVLRRWVDLLRPGGRLVLIEGHWFTGGGLHAREVVVALPASLTHIAVHSLSEQTELWGKTVTDERYAVVATLPPRA